jgi:EAL domain-containing protein (putative c-di-GMP-specific phosphodiesterase class I)/uncharacterized membrane protein
MVTIAALPGRLSAAVRATVSRTGGDEFVVLLNCSTLRMPGGLRATAPSHEQFHLEGARPPASIAIYPDNGRDLGELQRNADAAMYSAKARGRNRFCFYVPAMNERASDRLAVENDLRRALRGDEFFAEYQPQVNLATGEAVGFEALARWRRPDRGIRMPPAEFIPIAEETGLIVPLGERILEIACRQRRDCYDHGLRMGTVAVNVSALQFREVRFVDDVRRVLRATRLPPALLELEVTESVLMHGADTVAATLAELADLGVGLAIDDFGTGYSSLSYLKRFPVRRLKIDQSFVHEMTRDANSGAIVEAIIALGRVLGMSVVAEGVETAEQLQVLRDYGCDDVQGYFVRRPASAAEIMSLCASAYARAPPDGVTRGSGRGEYNHGRRLSPLRSCPSPPVTARPQATFRRRRSSHRGRGPLFRPARCVRQGADPALSGAPAGLGALRRADAGDAAVARAVDGDGTASHPPAADADRPRRDPGGLVDVLLQRAAVPAARRGHRAQLPDADARRSALGAALRERLTWVRMALVGAGIAGMLLIVRPGTEVFQGAALLVLGSASLYAMYQILTRKLAAEDIRVTLFYPAIVGTALLTVALPWIGTDVDVSWTDALLIVVAGLLGTVGHFMFIRAFQHAPASALTPFTYLQLVWATLIGWAAFDRFPDSLRARRDGGDQLQRAAGRAARAAACPGGPGPAAGRRLNMASRRGSRVR